MKKRSLSLVLALALLLSACGSKVTAATMHLRQTAGTVGVSDDTGKALEPAENLGLYSGYGVDTRSESYAWVDLDDVKLTKLDENSEIEITQDGKKLEIEVKSGALFFNVTEPLADDETLNIRTSTMMVGIRGTCGWVEVPDPEHMDLYLLEGAVECSAGENTAAVAAGEMAELGADGEILVTPLPAASIPEFVRVELENDRDLAAAILADTGIDVLNPDPAAAALTAYRPILEQAESQFSAVDLDLGEGDTVTYQYALVQMQTEQQIPALVLEREIFSSFWGDLCSALVFQYDPASQTVIQAEGELNEGVAGAGGYRGTLAMAGDGLGLLETSWSSGTGMGSIVRCSLSGDVLQRETVWSGNVVLDGGSVPSQAIDWHELADLSGLNSWTPPQPEQAVPPADENGGVLSSYTGTYTLYEVFHGGYGGGERMQDVTLAENGVVTGGGTSWFAIPENGLEPSSVTQRADGSIQITFDGKDGAYTVYPAGVVPEGYDSSYWQNDLDPNAVHLRYLLIDGGVMDLLYHADPASLGG